MRKKGKRTALARLVFCYLALLAVWVLYSVGCWGWDSLSGRPMYPLDLDDFDLIDMVRIGENTVVTTSSDAQMLLKSVPEECVSLKYRAEYSNDSGAIEIFYSRGQEDFSIRRRLWPSRVAGDTFVCALPRGTIGRLRLDPTLLAGVTITFSEIVLNAPRSFFSYFAVSRTQVFWFLILPALAASALQWLADLIQFIAAKKGMRS